MLDTLQTTGPDCATCWQRDKCADAQAGTFCPMWQTRQPEPRQPDPNDLWNQGEEAVF